jgi:PTS system fructose-specific IIC component
MLPMVTVGGLAIALGFTFSDAYSVEQKEGSLAWALNLIGSGVAFQLFVAMLSGFIAFSIADRFGLVPGLIGGMLAQHFGAGFLGGIASGFLAGYLTKFLAEIIQVPDIFKGLKAILILPLLSSLLVGLVMTYLIAPPLYLTLHALTGWLSGMQEVNALLFGMALGTMMAIDMGGPVNKAATTFAIGLLASKIYTPMATVMVAGMTPPLGLAIAAWLLKDRFDTEEREAAGAAFVLGLSFVTEGALPFAARDPLHVIPALIGGSAVGGGLAMFCGVEFLVPHGGLFATVIPAAVTQVSAFFVALTSGILVTVGLLALLKQPRKQAGRA